nr:hypothetical protein [Tanacetum cinerariifolium]
MATTIEQQVAMDEVLVPNTQRLRIGRRNFQLPSDIQSKESTLQLVYDVLRRCPFFKAFLVTADVPEIYMQEFWAIAYVHHHSIRFKMNNKKHIMDLESFKEMLHICPRIPAPKPKASARRKRSGSDTSITPPTATTTPKPTAVTPKLTAAAKSKQPTKATRAKSLSTISEPGGSGTDKGTGSKPGVQDVPTDESEEELSWNSSDDEGADDQEKVGDDDEGNEVNDSEEGKEDDDDEDKNGDERDEDDKDQEVVKDDDEQDDTERSGNDNEEGESDEEDDDKETRDEESFDPIPSTPESSEDEGNGKEDRGLNVDDEEHVEEEEEDELYRDVNINQGRGLQATLNVEDSHVTLTLVKPDGQQESSSVSSQFMSSMLNPTSDVAISVIPSIVHQYMNQQMNEAVRVAVQIQTERLRNAFQRENDEFLQNIDENMKRIIKEQVKGQVKEQVSRILSRIKQSVNAQLEAEVLTRSSHSSRTSYAVVADLSEIELKKILIEKWKAINPFSAQTNKGTFIRPSLTLMKPIPGCTSLPESFLRSRLHWEEESFDPILRIPEDIEDDGNGEEDQGLRISKEERIHEEEEADELYRDVDINQGRGLQLSQDIEDSHVILTPVHPNGQQESSSVSLQFVTSMLNPTSDAGMESIFATASSPMEPLQTSSPIMTPSTIGTITSISHAPIPPTTISSEVLQNLPTFDSVFRLDKRLKSLEASFSEYRQTNPFAEAVSNISGIVHQYMNQQMNEAIRVAVQIQTDQLRDSYQRENDEFLRTIDDNMKRIIKENLYKALVEAYEADKIILDTYGECVILKRRRDDDDDQGEGPFAGSDRGSKRQREGKEPESASAPLEPTTRSPGRVDILTPELLAGPTYELMKGSCNSLTELEYHLEEVYKATTDQLDWVNPEGQQYPHNLLQPLPLIPDNRGRRVIPFAHFINNDLEYLRGGASSRKYATSVTKTKATDYGHIKWIIDLDPIKYDKHAFWGVSHWGRKCQQFYRFAVNREFALDVYSKRRIIAVTDLKIVEWHNYKHLDWILVRRDDDKIYKFKEGDFKRLRLQDTKDMLLLLVQGKLSNLTVKECFAFNVSFRMFTRSIVIQRRVEDLQLGVERYQKRLNLTKPDTYRSDLKRREAYTAYSNPRGFIYQNKKRRIGPDAEDDDNELYGDLNINMEGRDSSSVSSQFVLNMLNPSPDADNFSEFMQTNQFAEAVSFIPGIVDRYLDHRMNEAVKVVVRLQSDRLRDEAQAENEDFLNKLDENIQKIIKEQVKDQVKVQVSKILPKIEKIINEQLEAKVLTRTSNSSNISYAVTADLSEHELKKILIEKMERNKSIHRSDQQKNLYKALVDAYECDKIILDTYEDTVTLKRRRDDEDKDEEPSARSDRGESARDVYFKRRIIAVTELQIIKWHNYKHLDWITVHRDDEKLYKFKEGDLKRLRIQDIKDMLLLLVQGKLTNLTVEERFAFNVSLRMFTRSIVIQRHVEDLQLGVESYQKKPNLTKPDTYIFDLKRKEAYIAYFNLRGFIYQNKDKQNRLMRIDELYKFSDGTLNDVL